MWESWLGTSCRFANIEKLAALLHRSGDVFRRRHVHSSEQRNFTRCHMIGSGIHNQNLKLPVLHGVRVIELAGIGPAPFCGMMLADHGAEVIRIDRPGANVEEQQRDVLLRSRRSITLDLKDPTSIEVVARLVETADGLIEGFRPGVAERLGLGPDALMQRNPALVYGRMTGWGQEGPLSNAAGHDLNYISINGCLAALGQDERPPMPPLNLIGDYGGGGMMLAFGFVAALLAARQSGQGRVIDCSMAEGSAALMAGMWSLKHTAMWEKEPGRNLLDGGAPFYASYACADGELISLGAIEPQFYARFVEALELQNDALFAAQNDQENWPAMKARLAEIFSSAPREVWTRLLLHRDCCYTEVVAMTDAPEHAHNKARGSYLEASGLMQPHPAPRFADTKVVLPKMWQHDADRENILAEVGMTDPDLITANEAH